jgi:hypothetical protein
MDRLTIAIGFSTYERDQPFWWSFILQARKAGHRIVCNGKGDDPEENARRTKILPEGMPLLDEEETEKTADIIIGPTTPEQPPKV